jgi:hypothetical protein
MVVTLLPDSRCNLINQRIRRLCASFFSKTELLFSHLSIS